MAISEKDRKTIVGILKKKTGFEWTSNDNGVYCNVILNASDRWAGARIFQETLKTNGIPAPKHVSSSIRGMNTGQARVSAGFTSNSALLELLKDVEPSSAMQATQLEKDNAQIAAMLGKKTGFSWSSDVDGVYCSAILDAQDRFEGERIFRDILHKHGIPEPQDVDSSIRGMGYGQAKLSVKFTSASALTTLLDESADTQQLQDIPNVNEPVADESADTQQLQDIPNVNEPVARAVAQALELCTTYYKHFKADFCTEAEKLSSDDCTLDLGIRKCYHVHKMMSILVNPSETSDVNKMKAFVAAFKEAKPVIDQRRDHPAITFLKAIATIITMGLAQFLGGIWNVRGQEVTQKIAKNVIDGDLSDFSPTS